MKLTERIHPPCNCKYCLEVEEKARKWEEFQQTFIISEPRIRFTNILQNQKLRELIEKRIELLNELIEKKKEWNEPYKWVSDIVAVLQKLLKESKK